MGEGELGQALADVSSSSSRVKLELKKMTATTVTTRHASRFKITN